MATITRIRAALALCLLSALSITGLQAQTAWQFTGEDCNGTAVDLYADLDAGKAVVLYYYMPDCGACPPPAQEIQDMANNIMNDFPDMVKGYAFPFLDIYDCASVVTWVDESHVPFFTPMDSGEYQVAWYGGFGMPTVVLLGGTDHRVMFSTLSYFTSDTTIMRDSILRLFGVEPTFTETPAVLEQLQITPNPSGAYTDVQWWSAEAYSVQLSVWDINGRAVIPAEQRTLPAGKNTWTLDVSALPAGIYAIQLSSGNQRMTQHLIIQR